MQGTPAGQSTIKIISADGSGLDVAMTLEELQGQMQNTDEVSFICKRAHSRDKRVLIVRNQVLSAYEV